MCNNTRTSRRTQRGISLIMVIFVLVIVSLLIAAMVRLNSGSQKIIGQEILSVRALFAAESGAQAAGMKIFPINAVSPTTCPASASFSTTFTATGLNGCTVSVTCAAVNASSRTVFTVISTGICDTGTERARRRIVVGLRTL